MKQGFSSDRYTVRAQPLNFVVFLVLGLLISFPVLSLIGRGPSTWLPITILLCIVWLCIGCLTLVIIFQRIVLLSESIHYYTLFSHRELSFTEITGIELTRRVGSGYRSSRTVRYFLQIDALPENKSLSINTKPFSKVGIANVIDRLATYAPSANLDANARELRHSIIDKR